MVEKSEHQVAILADRKCDREFNGESMDGSSDVACFA